MRKISAVCCLVIAFCIFTEGSLHADDAWTLKRCIEYALDNNPDLLAAKAKISVSLYGLDYQTNALYPRLDLSASTGYLSGSSTSPYSVIKGITEEWLRNKSTSGGYLSATLTMNAPIFKEGVFFGKNAPSINIASEQVSIDKYAFEAKKNEVIYNVTGSFFSLLKNNEDIKAADEHLRSLESDYRLAGAKYKEGLISKNDLLMIEVKLESGRKDIRAFRNVSMQLMADLAVKMGLEPAMPLTVSEGEFRLPVLDTPEHLIRHALENRPEIAAQKEQVSMARENLRLAENLMSPGLDFELSHSSAMSYSSGSSSMWTGVLKMSLLLYDFGATRSKIRGQEAMVTEAEKALLSLKNAVSQEVVNAYTNISNAWLDIGLKEKILEQAAENALFIKGQFQQGLVSLSVLLEAEFGEYDARKTLAQARYDLRSYYQQMLKTIGERSLIF